MEVTRILVLIIAKGKYGKNELIFNVKECYKLGSIIQI